MLLYAIFIDGIADCNAGCFASFLFVKTLIASTVIIAPTVTGLQCFTKFIVSQNLLRLAVTTKARLVACSLKLRHVDLG